MKAGAAGWMFAAPALIVIAVFFALPVLAALALSVTDFDIYALADSRNLRFVGLGNYAALLQNPLFWKALGNTLYFVVVGVPLSIAMSLGAALLLHSKLGWFKPFFRTAYDRLRPEGRMVVYGAASGPPEPVDIARLNARAADDWRIDVRQNQVLIGSDVVEHANDFDVEGLVERLERRDDRVGLGALRIVDEADAADDGRLKPGKLVLLTGMGAGLTWGSALIEWTHETTGAAA